MRLPVIEYSLRASLRACQQGDTSACDCPRYYPGTFDYNGRWFDFVARSEEVRIMNALIALQWILSRITVGLYYPDAIWYGFWSVFPVPYWWSRLLGDIVPSPNAVQEWYCVGMHVGSITYFLFMVLINLVLLQAMMPLIYQVLALSMFPFYALIWRTEMKDYLSTVKQRTEFLEDNGRSLQRRVARLESMLSAMEKKRHSV